MNVNTIQCNCTIEQALERNNLSADDDTIRILGLPKYLFEFQVELERPLISNREDTVSITVDLLTGTCRRNDSYPEYTSKELSTSSLLNPRIERKTAVEKARAKVRQRVKRWFSTFSTPNITLAKENQLYKLFWLVPSACTSTVTAIDSISGEIAAQGIESDELSQVEL